MFGNRPDLSNLWPITIIVFEYGQLGLVFMADAPLLWNLALHRWRRESPEATHVPPDAYYSLEDRTLRQEEARDLTDAPIGNWRL